ncbi:DNA polymerase Y family protein [Xenophilus aerolatus]|nr:DNA polymerase Y family protein [Xenophilus aerolatus]
MHWLALQWLPEPAAEAPAASASPAGAPPGDALAAAAALAAQAEAAPVRLPVSPEALGWWALGFTPHVTWQDEALLLEVSACERLWGGRRSLMRQLQHTNPAPTPVQQAQGATSLIALARLRMYAAGQRPPPAEGRQTPAALPLSVLGAAGPHLDVLARMGCRTWGQAAALPRGGFVRRFGAGLREALDIAWGQRPERHAWLTLPEVFDQKAELPALATTAPELLWAAQRLLAALRIWLQARQRGVLALELEWTLDLKRLNGVDLPSQQQLRVRTAEPTQDMAHLRRLLAERLAVTQLAAPTGWLRLRSLETVPWGGAARSFLPEDNRPGEPLHELVEKLSARLGPQQVLVARPQADHRPERMQAWEPAVRRQAPGLAKAGPALAQALPSRLAGDPGADLLPHWVMGAPLELEMHGEQPHYQGALRSLVGPQRIEGDGWWEQVEAGGELGGAPAERDYYVAESPGAGLVWIFRERPGAQHADRAPRWFLQGLYA